MKTVILIAAAALVAGPAYANAVPPQKSAYRGTYDAKRDRYCLVDRTSQGTTGTHIRPVECKTATEWADLGLTVEQRRR